MRKKFLFMICGALTISAISAQITLTHETSAPRIGDVFNYHSLNVTGNLDVYHGGVNQEWDMSAVEEGFLIEHKYVSVAESTQPLSASNLVCIAEMSGIKAETYYTASSTGLVLNKLVMPSVATTSYTDEREFLKFPLAYNQEYNETFAGTITNISAGQTFDVNGTAKIKADGYGKLKLPFGAVNNVLRVKVAYDYTYSMDFFGFPLTVSTLRDTVYLWYNANTRDYIANYSVGYGDTGTGMKKMSATLQYLSSNDLSLSAINAVYNNSVAIYPNPAQEIINIKGTNEIPDVKIYNVNGVLLRQEKSSVINISEFANGMYLIEISGKKYKIIKQ